MPQSTRTITVAFVLPHMKTGGIEHVVRETVNRIDRGRFRPVLILRRAEGALLDGIAPDVAVIGCGGRRAARLAPHLARVFAREGVDAVYAGTNAMNVAVLLAGRLMGRARPCIVISEHTSAEAYLDGAKAPGLRRWLARRLYPGADLLAVPLASIGQDWIDTLDLARPETRVLPNPVLDPGRVARLAADPPPREPGLVIAAGRLIRDKGHDLLIRAMARLPDARAEIWGEGPERDALASAIAGAGLGDRVRLMGLTDRLLEVFAGASAVALPSRREGFGNVVVEAMAAGTPVVATDCAGPSELLAASPGAGAIVPRNDPDALARALGEALAAPPAPAHVRAGREAALAYAAPAAVARFEEMIVEVLQRS